MGIGQLTGGMGQLGRSRRKAATPWYLAGGIDAANCVAAYQPKGAASYAASKVNLVNPGTYDLTEGGGTPAWDVVNGWTFTNDLLNSGIIPANDQTWSMIVRCVHASGYGVLGIYISPANYAFAISPNDSGRRIYDSGGRLIIAGSVAGGVFAVAGNKAYYNGSTESGTIPAKAGVLAGLRFGTAFSAYYWNGTVQAAAVYSAPLTPFQVAAITTAMQAL